MTVSVKKRRPDCRICGDLGFVYANGYCRPCWRAYHADYDQRNATHIAASRRARYANNPDSHRARCRQYYYAKKEQRRAAFKAWWNENSSTANARAREQRRRRRVDAPDEVRAKARDAYQRHREWYREYGRKRYENEHVKVHARVSTAVRKALQSGKAGRKWETILGYTVHDLIRRLKRTIPTGWTWQDYLDGRLQLDHRIPVAAFNMADRYDFLRCWSLRNLRLLPRSENASKGAKLDKPFQPSLAFGG